MRQTKEDLAKALLDSRLQFVRLDADRLKLEQSLYLMQRDLTAALEKIRVQEGLLRIIALGCKFQERAPENVYGQNQG